MTSTSASPGWRSAVLAVAVDDEVVHLGAVVGDVQGAAGGDLQVAVDGELRQEISTGTAARLLAHRHHRHRHLGDEADGDDDQRDRDARAQDRQQRGVRVLRLRGGDSSLTSLTFRLCCAAVCPKVPVLSILDRKIAPGWASRGATDRVTDSPEALDCDHATTSHGRARAFPAADASRQRADQGDDSHGPAIPARYDAPDADRPPPGPRRVGPADVLSAARADESVAGAADRFPERPVVVTPRAR